MKCGHDIRLITMQALLALVLSIFLVGCDESTTTGTPPADYTPLIATIELTPAQESQAPVALTEEDGKLAIVYSTVLAGTGDIYRLVLSDAGEDGVIDGIYDHYETTEYYPNENDSTGHFTVADHQQFSWIGAYETENDDPAYPADIFYTGPRQLCYDPDTERIYYSLIFANYPQIASTQSPENDAGSHVDSLVTNTYDQILEDVSTPAGRVPIWDYWYTVVNKGSLEYPDFAFSGGNNVTVSPYQSGAKWIAYSDSVLISGDRDGDEEINEDRPGVIEVWQNINEELYPVDDGMPGYAGVDDDEDGLADMADPQVAAMLFYNPTPPPADLAAKLNDVTLDPQIREELLAYLVSDEFYAWQVQNYNGAFDDDEDGRMDEDPSEQIDNDTDGLTNEDPIEPQIDQDIDGKLDDDGPDPNIIPVDNDGDGFFDEDGPDTPPIDNDGDGYFNEDPVNGIDDDGDGEIDEDSAWDEIDNDGDGLFSEDPVEEMINNDGDLDDDGEPIFDEDGPEPQIDNDDDGLLDEDPSDQVDNDGDGEFGEDWIDGIDNDDDGRLDEDPMEEEIDDDGDGRFSEDPSEQIDDDGDGLFGEDPSEQIDNDGDGLINEDPSDQIDNDGDGYINEDATEQLDDDWDGFIDEDPSDQIDNDGDGTAWSDIVYTDDGLWILSYVAEDGPEVAIDNDGDGKKDEDGPGDLVYETSSASAPGFPGQAAVDDDTDDLMDWNDLQVRHSTLRAERMSNYNAALDDDEDGISDEDGDLYGSGIWVLKIREDGTPNHRVVPISLTNDEGSQPVFNPVADELLYVVNGDIYRMFLTFSNDTVTVTGSENLTNTNSTFENFPSYARDGSRVVYCSNAHGSSDIWMMNADGSGQVRVTNDPGQEVLPSFTPAGNQILYESWLVPDGARRVMITTGQLP